MKNFFIKTFVIILLAVVLSSVNNFCFQGLFNLVQKAEAASPTLTQEVGVNFAPLDTCHEESAYNIDLNQSSYDNLRPTPLSRQTNSLLPCCLNGGHPSVVSQIQSIEIGKTIPLALSIEKQLPVNIFASVIYHEPILSPPKLIAVTTTILRL